MPMMLRKTGRECRLNFLKIATRHGGTDIHPVGMQGFQSTLAAPEGEKPRVVEEGQQKVLVIARQGDDGGRPFAACKLLDHALRTRTTINVITKENRHGMVERPRFHIDLD